MDTELRMKINRLKEIFSEQGRQMRKLNRLLPVKGERHVIELPDRKIDMVYYPADSENAPLLIGLHGGGFVFGGSAMDDDMWMAVSRTLDVNVASLDYRKCPDHRWPEPVKDVFEASCCLKQHASEFGVCPDHMWVMGCSAGANLAAAACIYAKQQGKALFEYQILIYPCIDLVTPPAEKGKEGSFAPEVLLAFNELYVDREHAKNILASPVFASKEDLAGLPRAIVVVAQKDELQHEGIKYVHMLEAAGVPVSHTMMEHMPHAYLENGYIKDTTGRDLDPWTLQCLEDGSMQQACARTLEYLKREIKKTK